MNTINVVFQLIDGGLVMSAKLPSSQSAIIENRAESKRMTRRVGNSKEVESIGFSLGVDYN